MKIIIKSLKLGDMLAYYLLEDESGTVGLVMLPEGVADGFTLEGNWAVDSLVQVKAVGDSYPVGFSNGHTMRNSQTTLDLKYQMQEVIKDGRKLSVITTLESTRLQAIHSLTYQEGTAYVSVSTRIINRTDQPVWLEMVSSYSLCGFSPIGTDERMEDYSLYRLRSKWSAEGKLERIPFCELQMEPSWQRYGVQSVRFGQVGSMPVRGFFPWMVVEDSRTGYCIGSQLYYPGSWQMELYTRDDRAALSGGIGDREFGHWMKCLEAGTCLEAPRAVLSVAMGDVDELSHRLTSAQKKGRQTAPAAEQDLPILFNEFCTTWGNPTQENLQQIVNAIKGRGFRYCVIDAGWYSMGSDDWNGDMGDWNINQDRFPGGFQNTVKAIREAGMIPGLWFEMECVGCNTEGFRKEQWQLTRDGIPIQTGLRRFWDMRNPQVVEYLSEKIIGTLKKYGFGYLKVDYNDNIGIGCDGAESLGEGLRQYVAGSQHFFQKIKAELPDIVIENCSSGGHRLEPSMQELTSMSSFSDAHECISIPIIAANVHRAILPEQSQIWAVLRAGDDESRLYYSMCNTLLGRMCLSGDIYDLNSVQWQIVEEGMAFYRKAAPVIKDGKSSRQGGNAGSYNKPVGWQALVREGLTEDLQQKTGQLLVVIHRFGSDSQMLEKEDRISVQLPRGDWKIADRYGRKQIQADTAGTVLKISGMKEMEAIALLLN